MNLKSFWKWLRSLSSSFYALLGGALFVVDVLWLVAHSLFPELPAQPIGLLPLTILLMSCLLLSSYTVWYKLYINSEKISESVPRYDVSVAGLRRYLVSNLIKMVQEEIDEINISIERKTNRQQSNQGVDPGGRPSEIISASKSFNMALSIFRTAYRVESPEDKVIRLEKHLEALKMCSEKIKNLYGLHLSFEASMYDKDIEFKIRTLPHQILSLGDLDEELNVLLPTTREPSSWLNDHLNTRQPSFISPIGHSNQIPYRNCYTSCDGQELHSDIRYANAGQTMDVFGSDIQITSSEEVIELEVSINSSKRMEPQIITKTIYLKDAELIEISKNDK